MPGATTKPIWARRCRKPSGRRKARRPLPKSWAIGSWTTAGVELTRGGLYAAKTGNGRATISLNSGVGVGGVAGGSVTTGEAAAVGETISGVSVSPGGGVWAIFPDAPVSLQAP